MATAPQSRSRKPDESTPAYRRMSLVTELSSSQRGYDNQWNKVAAMARDRDEQLCQDCLQIGGLPMAMQSLMRARRAHDVDHVIPMHARPDLKYDMSNLRTRCPTHHRKKTLEDEALYGVARRSFGKKDSIGRRQD